MPALPPRPRKVLALALVLLALAGVSAQQPDGLFPSPPKSPGKADILPVLREFQKLPELPVPPAVNPATLVDPATLPTYPETQRDLSLPSPGPALPPLPATPAQPAAPKPPVKYVNKPDVEFDYEVTKKGRAGVKSVSLWVREMSKQVFSFYSDPPAAQQPEWNEVAAVPAEPDADLKLKWKLPYDGRFDFRLQVIGANDRKSADIASKSEPELVVILDTKPPAVKDVTLEPPAAGERQAVIKWAATDANLGEKCVKLEYEQKPGGGWAVIAESELNSGSYSWALDDKLPVSTRVRVRVTDLAENSTAVASAAPTNLDSVVPEGRLTGVRAVEPSAPPVLPIPGLVPDAPRSSGGLELPPVPPMPELGLPAIPKAKG